MISASLSETMLRRIFIDVDSPYSLMGFSISLHTDTSQGDGKTEIDSSSYARAVVGHGEAYWVIGSRTVYNQLEIVFPQTNEDETWPAARSVGIWSMDTNRFLWSVPFDSGSYSVSVGDRLIIPVGGLEVGFG